MWKYASAPFETRDVGCQNCFMVMGFIERTEDKNSIEYKNSSSKEVSREAMDGFDRVTLQCKLCGATLQIDLPSL